MKSLLELLETPIKFLGDPIGTIENYPLSVLIWVGILVWAIIRLRNLKKQKKVGSEDKNKTNKIY